MDEHFFYCDTCGNLLIAAIASGVVPDCCGHEMEQLEANTTDGSHEKHLPVVTYTSRHSLKISIGSEPHPMTHAHHIRFVCLETGSGFAVRFLTEETPPEVCFRFNCRPIAVYAYCNLHGLWRVDVPEHELDFGDADCPEHPA